MGERERETFDAENDDHQILIAAAQEAHPSSPPTTTTKGHSSLMGKGKHRLYISLLYRQNADNFHWALTLGPKHERKSTKDSVRYDVANTVNAAWNGVEPVPWRYRYDPVNPLLEYKLVARVLIAKLPSKTSFEDWATTIHHTCRALPIVQNDAAWRCRSWVLQAMNTLRALGGAFSTIPDVQDGNAEEAEIIAFAKAARGKVLGGEIPVGDIHAIPLLDMRRTWRESVLRSSRL